ncbi:hypothetical protein GC096_00890 [Paenibacillus sp. LMG 31461]|uniref:alpha-L-fucosidase n=1 Tax=Paenibacillus plantarum TaxID=2654975 RepID=A0ABX1X3B1_9BACL|nr:alpha-L-fucosidase [Paenibacillus plantarum]NOU62599.1 hypothetical protein [Paenibacillus plantarum]
MTTRNDEARDHMKAKERKESSDAVALQHAVIGHADYPLFERLYSPNSHPDTAWFETAALGLFIHWGISAVDGECDLSWGMMAGKPWEASIGEEKTILPEDYFRLAERFRPKSNPAEEWLSGAAEAGFRYAVLTTRHHDGFSLWPSKWGQFNTAFTLNGRDFVGEFVEACRRNGLKVGLYYSPPDWYYNRHYMSFHYGSAAGSGATSFAGRAHYGMHHEPIQLQPQPQGWHEQFLAYIRGQVMELLTQYGKIDMLWFDGGRDLSDAISIEEIRKFQPGILINTRMHGVGDFDTPECHMPKERPVGRWEHCNIWAEGPWWAYIRSSEQYRPASWMLSRLAEVRAWGGNFLVNIGPKADGTLPEDISVRFAEVREWMRHSGESIYDVKGGPYPECSNVPVTCGWAYWYYHLLPGMEGPVILKETTAIPERVFMLRTGHSITFRHEGGHLLLIVPDECRTTLVDVVAIQWTASREGETGDRV